MKKVLWKNCKKNYNREDIPLNIIVQSDSFTKNGLPTGALPELAIIFYAFIFQNNMDKNLNILKWV